MTFRKKLPKPVYLEDKILVNIHGLPFEIKLSSFL